MVSVSGKNLAYRNVLIDATMLCCEKVMCEVD